MSRKISFVPGEFYHVYNRGTDKRNVVGDTEDVGRFMQSVEEFNSVEPIGSIYENSFYKSPHPLGHPMSKSKLVNLIAYCLNPNHYHLILEPKTDNGVEKFMQKLGNGYTKYFNNKHKRSGVLFQGKFKSAHIDSNESLLHLSIYVNLNNRTHQLGHLMSKLVRNSWDEYTKTGVVGLCKKNVILGQFKNQNEYKNFALDSLEYFVEKRRDADELKNVLFD